MIHELRVISLFVLQKKEVMVVLGEFVCEYERRLAAEDGACMRQRHRIILTDLTLANKDVVGVR